MSTIKAIDVSVSGFDPGTKYNFIFKNKGGNWPVRVSPLSGIFLPDSVKTYVYFCSNSGECPQSDSNVFYNVPANKLSDPGIDLDHKSLYTVLDLEIRDYSSNELLHSHPCLVQCDQCVPQLSFNFNDSQGNLFLSEDDGNSKIFNIFCTGLIPNQQYNYVLDGGGGNWPLKITPRSGLITTSSADYTINGLLSFCPSTGACPSTDPSIINYQNIHNRRFTEDPYSIINVSLTPIDNTFQNKIVGSFSATCSDCIPSIQITSPSFVDVGPNHENNNFEVVVKNLVIGERYNYSFEGIDGNWPVIISPHSGTIVATADSMTLPFVTTFCTATGLCDNGTPGVMTYTNTRSTIVSLNAIKKQSRFKISLNQNAYSSPVAYSNDIIAVCSDCLPKLQARLPSNKNLTIDDGNYQDFTLDIDNMVPGVEYQYVFKNIDSNWPALINPISGTIIRDDVTSATYQVPVSITLCQSTGLCPNGCPNVLPYTYSSSCVNKIARFKAEVSPIGYSLPSTSSNAYVVTCENCIPKPHILVPNVIVDEYNNTLFDVQISGLSSTTEYNYKFISLDANWPVDINPISGVITAVDNYNLSVKTSFCKTSGVCPNGNPGILKYTPGSTSQFNFGYLNKFAKIRLELDPILPTYNDLPTIYSNEALIQCSGCVNAPSVTIEKDIVIDNSNIVLTHISGHNLSQNTQYNYKIVSLDSNWPTIINPISGIVVGLTGCDIPTTIFFCESTGLCPKNNSNVLNYTISAVSPLLKYTKFQVEFDAIDSDLPTVYSNESLVRCSGCIPNPTVSVDKDIAIGSNNIAVIDISGLNLSKDTEYRYSLISLDSNWPTTFNPVSGVVLNTTECSIPTTISFCASTGVCENGSRNVLPYTASASYNQFTLGLLQKSTKFQVKFDPINNDLPTIYSNESLVRCVDCIPEPEIVLPDTIIVSGLDPITFVASGVGLLEGIDYTYKFIQADSNWPTILNPISGNVISSKDFQFPIEVSFCASTGVCPQGSKNVLSYNLANNDQYDIGFLSRFAKAKMQLIPNIAGLPTLYSNETTIVCSGCISPLSAQFIVSKKDNPDKFVDNYIDLNLFGLIPGVKYSYQFEPVNNNWPMIINPLSGLLSATKASESVRVFYDICYTTGLCPSTGPNVLPYTYDLINSNISKQLNVRGRIKALNNNLKEQETVSNIFSIRCDNETCLPIVSVTGIPSVGSIKFGETYNFKPVINNLISNVVYNYKYTSINSNWPSIIYPASGTIRNVDKYEIPTTIQFCKSTGLCPSDGSISNVLSYDLDTTCQTTNSQLKINKFTNFMLEIEPQIPGLSKAYSNPGLLTMSDNIGGLSLQYMQPATTTTVGSNVLLGDNGISLGKLSEGIYQLSTLATGLIDGEAYEYTVNYLDSNWPIVISPQSGSFIATNVNKFIYTDIGFCYPSGECASNSRDAILKYRINSLYNKDKKQFLLLNLSVQQSGCIKSRVYGQDYRIECNNCLNMIPLSVSISGGPVLQLGGCCSGTRLIVANVSGALPKNRYRYEFTSLSNNITFNQPYSGYATFSNNGSGVIMGIANTNLNNYDEGVIRFKLLNEENNTETSDYIGIKCGPDCAT